MNKMQMQCMLGIKVKISERQWSFSHMLDSSLKVKGDGVRE